jgi:hypothetical protein
VWIDKPDGSKQKLCANYTFQDCICKFSECTFFHAKMQKNHATSVLADLQKWAINKENAEFVNAAEADSDGQ